MIAAILANKHKRRASACVKECKGITIAENNSAHVYASYIGIGNMTKHLDFFQRILIRINALRGKLTSGKRHRKQQKVFIHGGEG